MKFLKGWRTVVINSFVGFSALLLETLKYLSMFDWSLYLEPRYAMYAVLGVNLINLWLRFITTTGVGEACAPDEDCAQG